jgi:multimeric flavodoxin WrbA
MIKVDIRILGISGSPIEGGNCDVMVQEALKTAAEIPGVETEFITLANKQIALCRHCQWCIENRSPCKIQDDAGTRSRVY